MYGISSNVAGPEEHSRYYEAYKTFFRENIKDKGIATVLEEFVFSPSANVSPAGEKQPAMLKRLLSGLVHPIIHTGYGLEFGLPGMTVEGSITLESPRP